MFGGKSQGGANDSEILLGEDVALFDFLACVDGASEMRLLAVLWAAFDSW